MVKTTINLDAALYRLLVKEAVEKYGTTKTLSRIINEKLKKLGPRNLDIVIKTSGLWNIKESGYEYTKRLRSESEKRLEVIA